MLYFQGLVGAVFEGIGVSTGSYIGGILISRFNGSTAFRLFSFGAFFFFGLHVAIQWLIRKCSGPYGKKSTVHGDDESNDRKSNDALEINQNMGRQVKVDDGFKDIDLTK